MDTQGWRVVRVDGEKIRNTKDVKFIGGDNPAADPDVPPAKTIWIEKMHSHQDECAILIHELVEYSHMVDGKVQKYDVAHKNANAAEKEYRHGKSAVAVLKKSCRKPFLEIALQLFAQFSKSRVAESIDELYESLTAPHHIYDHPNGDSLWMERHPNGYAVYHVCNKRGTCIGKFPGKTAPVGKHKARFVTDDEIKRAQDVMKAAREKGLVTESFRLF